MNIARQVPSRIGVRCTAQHADGHVHVREFPALQFDRVDARDQPYRLVRDQVAVQQAADLAGIASFAVAIIVGDQFAQRAGIARLGGRFAQRDERADLILRRAGRSAGRAAEYGRGEQRLMRAQDKPSIAAGRR